MAKTIIRVYSKPIPQSWYWKNGLVYGRMPDGFWAYFDNTSEYNQEYEEALEVRKAHVKES